MKPQSSLKKSLVKAPACEDSIAETCRKGGIAQSLYYTWSKGFMEADKRRLAGDTARSSNT